MELCRNALRAANSNNVQRTEHDRIFAVRQSDNDQVPDNRCVFGMFDTKNVPTAAMDREGRERSAFQEKPNPLKHPLKLAPTPRYGNDSGIRVEPRFHN
jgi:hypothetical protein